MRILIDRRCKHIVKINDILIFSAGQARSQRTLISFTDAETGFQPDGGCEKDCTHPDHEDCGIDIELTMAASMSAVMRG